MKLQILQENLQKAVSIASRFASPKAQLPVLGNMLLSTQKTKLFVSATNLETSVSVQVGAKIEEEGEISLPAKTIFDVVTNLPSETISLAAEKEQLKISLPGFSSAILGMNSSDFPKIPTTLSGEIFNLPKTQFVSALAHCLFATSIDDSRPVLTGVLLSFSESELLLVATDGFRLSQEKIKFEFKKGSSAKKVILPKSVLNELVRLAGDLENEVGFCLHEKEKQIVFGVGETVLSSRLIEGEYPDFEKIIPKSSILKITTDKIEFERAIKLTSVFARSAANVVKIKVLKDGIKVTGESGQSGSQEVKVESKVEWKEKEDDSFEIAFNFHYLEDFLRSIQGEEVRMEFVSTDKAGIFLDTSEKDYLHLIMPVRLQG